MYYEQSFTVDSREVDLTGRARPSAVLGYLQESATRAGMALGVSSPEVLEKYHARWLVVRAWYRLDEPLNWNDTVTIRTWHRGGRLASSYRDFDLYRDGQPVGEAVTLWVLSDVDSGKLVPMGHLPEYQDTGGGELCKGISLHKLRLPAGLPNREERPLRYSDTDYNGHVNNNRYADFACDALHLEALLPGRFVRECRLSYLDQCMAGERLTLETGEQDGALYARGLGPEGDERFACSFTLGDM